MHVGGFRRDDDRVAGILQRADRLVEHLGTRRAPAGLPGGSYNCGRQPESWKARREIAASPRLSGWVTPVARARRRDRHEFRGRLRRRECRRRWWSPTGIECIGSCSHVNTCAGLKSPAGTLKRAPRAGWALATMAVHATPLGCARHARILDGAGGGRFAGMDAAAGGELAGARIRGAARYGAAAPAAGGPEQPGDGPAGTGPRARTGASPTACSAPSPACW